MYLACAQGRKLEAERAPAPIPLAPNDVVVRLKAIAINPANVKMIDQGHRVTEWPIVSGLDGAGVVEAVGGDVEDGRKET